LSLRIEIPAMGDTARLLECGIPSSPCLNAWLIGRNKPDLTELLCDAAFLMDDAELEEGASSSYDSYEEDDLTDADSAAISTGHRYTMKSAAAVAFEPVANISINNLPPLTLNLDLESLDCSPLSSDSSVSFFGDDDGGDDDCSSDDATFDVAAQFSSIPSPWRQFVSSPRKASESQGAAMYTSLSNMTLGGGGGGPLPERSPFAPSPASSGRAEKRCRRQ